MPMRSRAQWRLMHVLEKEGAITPGTAAKWRRVSGPYQELPEHVTPNPSMTRDQAARRYGNETVENLSDAYQRFQGGLKLADAYEEIEIPQVNGGLVVIGPCCQINYEADKGDGWREYYHRFENPLPVVCHDMSLNLFLVGGGYTIGPDGIED